MQKIEFISEEKLKLMQDKDLLHYLYMLTLSGTVQMKSFECEQLADMVLRLTSKEEGKGKETHNHFHNIGNDIL